mgnify:FL=1
MRNERQPNLEHDNSYKFRSGRDHYYQMNHDDWLSDTFVIETSPRTDKIGRVDTDNYVIEPQSMKWVYFVDGEPKFKNMTKKQIIQMFMNEVKYLKEQIAKDNKMINKLYESFTQ